MTITEVPLNEAAKAFRVHPRTILRAIEDDVNIYWAEDHNPTIQLKKLAEVYGCHIRTLIAIFEGRDSLLTADEAASELQIQPRTFRRNRPKHLKHGGIVRYERSIIVKRALGD